MTQFIGDYKTFYKFVDGYARNKTLNLTRAYKSGVCACCGKTETEIQSAHKRGFERKELVKKCFNAAILKKSKNIYTIDMDVFEKEFIEFTSNISNFHFLCGDCHKSYDDNTISEDDFRYKCDSVKEPRRKRS